MKSKTRPKQFLELHGKPIIIFTLELFERHPEIDQIIVPCVAGWESYLEDLLIRWHITKVKKIVTGGKDTQESKMNALNYIATYAKDDDIIMLHDAVRPVIDAELISANLESVRKYGNAVSAVPFTETGIVSKDRETTTETIVRNTLFIAKAPQSFYFKDVYAAHKAGETMDPKITIDTCSLMTTLGIALHMVPCSSSNIKITTPEDFFIFRALNDMRESEEIMG